MYIGCRAKRTRGLAWLAIAVLIVSCIPVAAVPEESGLKLTVAFGSGGNAKERVWEFPYDDAMFEHSDDTYFHRLAQASLGLALSAFRTKNAPLETQDDKVLAFLTQAGFDNLQSDEFDITPTKETIATAIGSKIIGGSTVVAVAVSGGNYKDEWLSNFDIGNDTRHAGFNYAAQKVEARIRDYLTAHGIADNAKLWICGYSRSAAVSNIAAADMTDSGLFKEVYAYTFATPRNTRQPGSYPNIFNIVGKFDPVAAIPFAEWGFGRNGVDMYTPAQETDSDYRQKKAAANEVSMRLTDQPFWNNVENNNTLRTILDFLYSVVPDTAVYTDKMQQIIESVWQDRSLPNLAGTITRLMEEEKLLDDTNRYEMEQLLDYLSMTTYSAVTGGAGWYEKATVAENLAREHYPEVYISWMFSTDDAAELFNDSVNYLRINIQSSVKISIFGGGTNFCLTVLEDGTVSDWLGYEGVMDDALPVEQRPQIAVARKGTQTIITLPKDEAYVVLLEALKSEPLTYYATAYTAGMLKGDMQDMNIIEMEKGKFYSAVSFSHETDKAAEADSVFYADNDYSFSIWSEELSYSPAVMMVLENQNVYHLTWSQMMWLMGGAIVLVLAVITLTTVLLVKRHRRKRRSEAARAKAEMDAAAVEVDSAGTAGDGVSTGAD